MWRCAAAAAPRGRTAPEVLVSPEALCELQLQPTMLPKEESALPPTICTLLVAHPSAVTLSEIQVRSFGLLIPAAVGCGTGTVNRRLALSLAPTLGTEHHRIQQVDPKQEERQVDEENSADRPWQSSHIIIVFFIPPETRMHESTKAKASRLPNKEGAEGERVQNVPQQL